MLMPRRILTALALATLSAVLLPQGTALAQSNVPASAQTELFLQLQQLQEEVTILRGLLEEQQNALNVLQRESLERHQALEARLASSTATAPATSTTASTVTEVAGTDATSTATPAEDAQQEQQLYEAAFERIKARDFDKAEQAFADFFKRYPNGQYSANALYWLGEVYLIKNETDLARKAFARVVQLWPEHAKVPDALYKQADACQRLGQNDEARSLLNQVIEQYPDSSAAKLAERDLQQNP